MSQTIKLPNYPSNNLAEYTRIDADVASAATSIAVQNAKDFAAGNFAIVGDPGKEQSEIATIQSVTLPTTITLASGLKFAHNKFDFLYKLNGDKLNIYRAPNVDGTQPADSSFAVIDTVVIDYDQATTSYVDTLGSSAYWYKYTFLNSTTLVETNLADSRSVRGGNNNYVSIDSIRNEAGFNNNRNITDALIDEKRQIAQGEVDGALSGIYVVPFTTPVNPTIENVTLQLATGYLLMNQFSNGSSRYDDGEKRVKEAQATLERIKSGQLALIGVTGIELPQTNATSNGFSGWPDNTTAGLGPSENGAGDFMFKRSSIDGYGTRVY